MNLRRPGLWLGVASALLVILVVWADRHRDSPGPVSATHAQEPSLAGRGCEQCHGKGSEGMSAACASCHAEIATQIAAKRGFHGKLAGDPNRCETCHLEHRGRDFPLVGAQSFALAGVPERKAYAHAGLDFHLTGRHASLACADCHKEADATVLAKGSKRFLGLDQACARCHEDVHKGKLPDCASCHGEEHPFAKVANFVHTTKFPLTDAHAKPGCTDCHAKDSAHAIEAVPGKPVRACEDCHASPHAPGFLAASARALGKKPAAACVDCHPATHASFAGSEALLTKAQHAASGFALDPPHDQLACEACHAKAHAKFREAYPGRKPDDCAACHADPHAGQFAKGPFTAKGCLACHDRHRFEPSTFDLAAHAKTAFPLTDSHAAVPCARCHADTQPVPGQPGKTARVFHGTQSACKACHPDAHQGFFDRPGLLARAERANGCAACHGSATFSAVASFDHAARTGFALEGAHARAGCETCHVPLAKPDASDRRFGRAVVGVTPASCHVCHADLHRGAFDRPGAPASVEGRVDCARCHTTDSFKNTKERFDHALWTGYALDGAHAKLECASCHESSRPAGAAARTLAPAKGTDCAACHADPHVGQFAVGGRTDCARCHTAAESFQRIVFDHDRDSRFRLDEGHRKLACGACHLRVPLDGGESAVRYKPLGTGCGDCHEPGRSAGGRRPR